MNFLAGLLLSIFSINSGDILHIRRLQPNTMRDYYLCSTEIHNCEEITRYLIAHATQSIIMQDPPLDNKMIKKALFDANEKGIPIRVIIKSRDISLIDFLSGNDIPTWVDNHKKMKRFIIIDGKIVVTGPFTFTGVNGTNVEDIEVDTNPTISYVYENEFNKHRSHSQEVKVDLD